jgi:hypothetical protein
MVEPEKNLNVKPGLTGFFILDLMLVYFSGMGFWSVFFWVISDGKSILSKDIIENSNYLMLPVVAGWSLVNLIHKAFWVGTVRNRKDKN